MVGGIHLIRKGIVWIRWIECVGQKMEFSLRCVTFCIEIEHSLTFM